MPECENPRVCAGWRLQIFTVISKFLCAFSVGERIILAWLNHHYERQRHYVWGTMKSCSRNDKGGVPPSRWVVNFDYDLLDGLVMAAVVAAYCPWLVSMLRMQIMVL